MAPAYSRVSEKSSSSAIAGDVLVREPEARGRLSRLPEHVDRDAAARIPIAADAQPMRLHFRDQPFGDADRAILVKAGVVAEGGQEQLQRLGFDDRILRRIVDD